MPIPYIPSLFIIARLSRAARFLSINQAATRTRCNPHPKNMRESHTGSAAVSKNALRLFSCLMVM
jgi:hypothetical protein